MASESIPYHKLYLFKEKLGINESILEQLSPYRDLFVGKTNEFATYFYSVFSQIPETRRILTYTGRQKFLLQAWAHWLSSLFRDKLDDEFLSYLWRIGRRHVEVNLDQRFTNLGFSVARQFCQQVILAEIPPERVGIICQIVDKLLDFCLLVETDAYIEASTHCDLEVIRGIADRVRNPVTVIGGLLKRLQKQVDVKDPTYSVFESLISESAGCELVVADIKTYIEMFQQEPTFQQISIETLIGDALDRLRVEKITEHVRLEVDLDQTAPFVMGSLTDLRNMFYYILQNSLEAVNSNDPYIKICSHPIVMPARSLEIEIFNAGSPPKLEDIDKLFYPFYSTKSNGTGFGLPIAKLAVRKCYGKLLIQPISGKGTNVRITLPLP
ncbi:MAG: protoglobin domain-containing protein [Dissulfurispiraceae bacterium]